MVKTLQGFRMSFEVSLLAHIGLVLLVWWLVHFHAPGLALPPASNPFEHAVAISLTPAPNPQPKPKVQPPTPHIPKPQPPAIETQATEAVEQTPPPAQHPSPPETPQQEQDQEQSNPDYQQIAEMILEQNKRYPREAVMSGTEGEVQITYIVNRQGTVLGYTIEKSSGSQVLDEEVKRLIRSVRFPPFPVGDNDQRKTLDVTIEFTLSGNVGS